MKNFMKLGALSLALIASLVLLSNTTKAADVDGNVSLEITTTSGTCTYGTSLFVWFHAAQYATFNITGENFWGIATPTVFECVDTEGLASWTMTMQANSTLSDSVVAHDIPADNVFMIANENEVSAGHCDTGINQTTWARIGTTPRTILNKNGIAGDICSIKSTLVNLAVEIPASQAVGVYTGELLLVMPF